MIAWLLKELEKNPTTLFHKKDLLKKSKQQFENFRRQGFLTYVQPSDSHETYPCNLPCSNTCPMEVVEMDGGLFAICPQDSEIDPIPLEKDELGKYSFSVEKFLGHVRMANRLGGALHRIDKDYLYFGYTSFKNNRVGFVFGFAITPESVLELIGLKHLCEDDDYLVFFCPDSVIEDISLRKELSSEKIVQASFVSSLDFQTFRFSIDRLVSEILERRAETEQKSRSVKESPKEDKNVFRKDGDFWQVAYQGSATITIKNSKGMFYIHRLLGKPDESISAMELINASSDVKLLNQGNGAGVEIIDMVKPQELVDYDYLEQCQRRLSDIENELVDAEKNSDLAKQRRLDKEREEISNLLKTNTFREKSAKFTDRRKKARIAVTNAINRALSNIEKYNQSLYKHLDNAILGGSDFTYTPDKEINWAL